MNLIKFNTPVDGEASWLNCSDWLVQWLSGLVARLTVSSVGVVFQSDRKRDGNCQLNDRFTAAASLVEEQSHARACVGTACRSPACRSPNGS